jgi:hypothetical protein
MIEEGWITKAQAAAQLGCDERTIERRARAGRISAKARLGFPTLYLATDVEMLRQTGGQEVRTGLLEPGAAGNGNGHGSAISNIATSDKKYGAADDPIRQLAALVVQALTQGPIGPTGPTSAPTGPTAAYVDKTAALAIAGVSYGQLRAAVQAGEVKQRGRRYRRQDLEAL